MAIDISKMRGKLAQAKGKSTQQAKFWKPQTGTQTIRILPTEDGDPFKSYFFHYGINNESILCPKHNFGEEVQFSPDGRYLAIGQPSDRYDPDAGVYIYGGSVIICESGSSGWAQTQLIQAPDIADEQENVTKFGICVDFFAQQTGASTYYKLTIGQPHRQKQSAGGPNYYRGTVHVYESKQEGSEHVDFSEYQELLPETTKLAQLGYGLAGSSDGKWMFADAVRENIESWAAGSLYLYEWSNEY